LNNTICIVGAGTYGSYLVNAILESCPKTKIILIEAGDQHVKSEREIGFSSFLKKIVKTLQVMGVFLD
jgi:prephenate dehydrogenase